MENEKRYSTRTKSERCDKLKISSVAVVFLVCSIAILATRYRQDIWNFDRENGNDHQIEEVATETDASEVSSEEKTTEKTTTEVTTTEQPTTEKATTEAPTSEEATTAASSEEGGSTVKYVNIEDPDTSSKGNDWYDKNLYTPGNVTDDAYFDTAVLIGDARTEGLSLYTGMSNLDAFCSKGLNIEKVMTEPIVSTSEGMLTALEALKLKEYENIYISFGINELGWIYEDIFVDDYKAFIDEVRAIQPNATIYVENILPVSKALSDEDEIYNNSNIKKFNKLLKGMCKDYGDVIYLDVASSVTVDGVLPADASTDGRHCNQAYCEKWLDYIRQNVYIKK